MLHARHSHGICYLASEVYVIGGVTPKEYSSGRCERFNVESKSWQGVPASAYPRLNPKLCASFNTKLMYVFGGVPDDVDANKSIEVLDTETMEWHSLAVKLPIEFRGSRLHFCLMIEGKFYMPPLAVH